MRRTVQQPTLFERVLFKVRVVERPSYGILDTATVSHSPAQAARVFADVARHSMWVTPTLTLHDLMLRIAPRDPVARDTSLMTEPPKDVERKRSPHVIALATSKWKLFTRLIRELRDAHVPLLAGTDIPLQAAPGFSLQMELALLQSAGLTPLEALRTGTLNPAQYQHAQDSLGTVAAGRLADLVVLRDDPLRDVRAVRSIDFVVSRGRVYARRDLDAMVEQARVALRELRLSEKTRHMAER
ncbi:MAG: amidohydrolase family protein [Gemmatimonadaceae bacterium]|nr:amidohydrolase family protein [Gemmatimonadaceae bacterium]